MNSAFVFLCKLAWEARYRIPLIISVVFIAFDIHMQVEINVEMRSMRYAPEVPLAEDNISLEGSWITIEEGDVVDFDDEAID